MNIENHINNARKSLDFARYRIISHDYDTAIAMLAVADSAVRCLTAHVLELKRAAASTEVPAGGD